MNIDEKKVLAGYTGDIVDGFKPITIDASRFGEQNYSQLYLGATQGGKSACAQTMALEFNKAGATIICFDIHETLTPEALFENIRDEFESRVNRVDGYVNPIPCPLADPIIYKDGVVEQECDTAAFLVDLLANKFRFGVRQTAICRKALKYMIADKSYKVHGFKALESELEAFPGEVPENVIDKLALLFDHNVFIDGELPIKEGAINIFDVNKYDRRTQEVLVEIILFHIWRHKTPGSDNPILIYIDEFQNIGMDQKHGVLSMIVAEGRKFGINVMLITQSLGIHFTNAQQKLLMQCRFKFFFKPSESDANEIATLMSPIHVEDNVHALSMLEVGECYFCGTKYENGIKKERYLKLIPRNKVEGTITKSDADSHRTTVTNEPGSFGSIKLKKKNPVQ